MSARYFYFIPKPNTIITNYGYSKNSAAPAATDNTDSVATTAWIQANAKLAARPVNTYYAQYPAAAANDYATAFPAAERPGTLFGGTWTMMWESESVFFRTGGSLAAESDRANGKQEDAIRDITGNITGKSKTEGMYGCGLFSKSQGDTYSGALEPDGTTAPGAWGWSVSSGNGLVNGLNFKASLVVPTAAENRPINRRIIIWKRTA